MRVDDSQCWEDKSWRIATSCGIVVGMPSLKIEDSYKQLPLYQMAISELDLLKASP